ncbi:MAG TPA: hypothetical protein VF492_00355, partial [Verrucomicrobiae bacterium]
MKIEPVTHLPIRASERNAGLRAGVTLATHLKAPGRRPALRFLPFPALLLVALIATGCATVTRQSPVLKTEFIYEQAP